MLRRNARSSSSSARDYKLLISAVRTRRIFAGESGEFFRGRVECLWRRGDIVLEVLEVKSFIVAAIFKNNNGY